MDLTEFRSWSSIPRRMPGRGGPRRRSSSQARPRLRVVREEWVEIRCFVPAGRTARTAVALLRAVTEAAGIEQRPAREDPRTGEPVSVDGQWRPAR